MLMLILSMVLVMDARMLTLQRRTSMYSMIVLALVLTYPGYRRLLGMNQLWNPGFYQVTMRMMEENPGQFRRLYRMTPQTFLSLESDLWASMYRTAPSLAELNSPDPTVADRAKKRRWSGWRGPHPEPTVFRFRLLVTIYFLANGCTYSGLAVAFGMTLDWRDMFVAQLAALKTATVRWPSEMGTRAEITAAFAACPLPHGVPAGIISGLLGCIDGTFIRILRPLSQRRNPQAWNSYKKFYAVQCLAVCGANFLFYFFEAGRPGSWTDSCMLERTLLFRLAQVFVPAGFYLFGDAGFGQFRWLMTPFTKPQLKRKAGQGGVAGRPYRKAVLYNDAQASARVHIEQAFGILKNRWQVLKLVRTRLDKVPSVVYACVVLHNYCILEQDIWETPDPDQTNARANNAPDREVWGHSPQPRLPKWATECPTVPVQGMVPPTTNAYHSKPLGATERERLVDKIWVSVHG